MHFSFFQLINITSSNGVLVRGRYEYQFWDRACAPYGSTRNVVGPLIIPTKLVHVSTSFYKFSTSFLQVSYKFLQVFYIYSINLACLLHWLKNRKKRGVGEGRKEGRSDGQP